MFKKLIYVFAGLFVVTSAFGEDKCVQFKSKPTINLSRPDWVKKVVQPLKMMDLYHGNVIATLTDKYDIVADIYELPNNDGFCVGIKEIDAVIGYSEFLVKIDMRHQVNSCSYNAVLEHEDEHISAYLSVIDDYQSKLKKSLYSASGSIMPIYTKDKSGIDAAVNKLNTLLQKHPEIVLVKQQISGAQEIRNAKIDEHKKKYQNLDKCND